MNETEASRLLGHCAAFDNRKPSAAAATAWAAALHDVPLDQDAKAAVAAYYSTPPKEPDARLWILPHHVRTLRSKIRSARLENFQYQPVADETPREYLARYRGQVQAIASGQVAPPPNRLALEGGPSASFMRQLEARGWQGNRTVPGSDEESLADTVRRAGPLGVVCPACSAAIGHPCKSGRVTAKFPLGKPKPRPCAARLRGVSGESQLTPEQRATEEQRIREAAGRAAARHLAEEHIPDAEIVEEAS
ncbi:zinc finger domain-containing protein [[Kitasatospora] papulosa]|uniref:zinc finger domain-containing protein n=1 Tax=[Kitasatospora] papulosa TaxID=1464011 RepID=UPI0036910B0F